MQPILKINLGDRTTEVINVPKSWEFQFLGGSALAARLLYPDMVQELDPFSPDNPLLFMTGPLTGTSGPAVGRYVVCSKSPATRLWAESNCGGFWGPELRKTGYDGIWVTGRADSPVYISINDSDVDILDASHLWGLDTYQTQTAIRKEINKSGARIASIGIAGENKVSFALILCDHGRVAGRTGMGAVMGSKNLKAIAVSGSMNIPLYDEEKYKVIRSRLNKNLRNENDSVVLRELGTSGIAEYLDYLEEMPKKYFQHGNLGKELRVSGAELKDTILTGVSACHACVIACGRVVALDNGEKRKGPEYETMVGFGPNLLINDPVFVTRMGEICDKYGLDTISTSNVIGLAFHLFEIGKINTGITDGLILTWGDELVVEKLIHKIAKREGIGNILANGALEFAKKFNVADEAVQVKGLEAPYHDPRGASGMALVYATSPRGACHKHSNYYIIDLGKTDTSINIQYYDRLAGPEKAANVALHQNWTTLLNSLVMCTFANITPFELAELIIQATGFTYSIEQLLLIGERAWNLKRAINIKLGLKKSLDTLPKAFLKPYIDVMSSNKSKVPDFYNMLSTYYSAREWSEETGFPEKSKLEKLNLDWVIADIYQETL